MSIRSGLQVIAGRNGAGKSCVVRGMSAVMLNTMSLGMIRRGKKKAAASIRIDGRKIKRTRCGPLNTYHLDGVKSEAFRKTIPEDIAAVLNVAPESFQRQPDPLFWMSESPGSTAKRLNELSGCSVIDEAQKKLRSELRGLSAKAEEVREQQEALRIEQEALAWAKAASDALAAIESRQRRSEKLAETIEGLEATILFADNANGLVQSIRPDELDRITKALLVAREQIGLTSRAIEFVESSCQQIEKQEQRIKELERKQAEALLILSATKKCPLCQRTIDHWH